MAVPPVSWDPSISSPAADSSALCFASAQQAQKGLVLQQPTTPDGRPRELRRTRKAQHCSHWQRVSSRLRLSLLFCSPFPSVQPTAQVSMHIVPKMPITRPDEVFEGQRGQISGLSAHSIPRKRKFSPRFESHPA